jgi:hypothetical protein
VDVEAKLDRKIRELLGRGAEDYKPEDWLGLRANVRLTLLYPGKWVVFRDHYTGAYHTLRLVHREVLHVGRTCSSAQKFIEKLPKEEQSGVKFDYVEPRRLSQWKW